MDITPDVVNKTNPNSYVITSESLQTDYPYNFQAGYQKLFNDPSITNIPVNQNEDPFYRNLVYELDPSEVAQLGNDLSEQIDNDEKSRERWTKMMCDGIDYLGLGGERSKVAYGPRNNDIYASTLLNVILNSAAQIYTQIFPSGGIGDTEIFGNTTPELEDRAERNKLFFDYATSHIMREYKADKKQSLMWMVACGSVFTKVYIDPIKDRPCALYIRPDDMIVNAEATSLEDAERITHRFIMSERMMKERFKRGIWYECYITPEDYQQDKVRRKIDYAIGIDAQIDDNIKIYSFDETMVYRRFSSENNRYGNRLLPYIVTKDKNSGAIVEIRRNWNKNDQECQRKNIYVHHKYQPGFNFFGLGLYHLCLGLAKAETEIQQEMIKGAALANAPVLFQQTGMKNERTQYDTKPGSVIQLQAFNSSIQDSLMPMPFPQPAPIMMELKKELANEQNNLAAAQQLDFKDVPSNVSGFTMSAVLSKMHVKESALMSGLYDSFQQEFQLIYNTLGEWLPPDVPYPFFVPGKSLSIMKNDFTPNIQIRPVMDPNSSSQITQIVNLETILQLAQANPDLYNVREVHQRLLKTMKIHNIESLMKPEQPPPPPPPPKLDPTSEYNYVMQGMPIKNYPDQDDDAHNIVHKADIERLSNDQTQDNSVFVANLQAHVRMHDVNKRMRQIEALSGMQIPQQPEQVPPVFQNQIAVEEAKATMQLQQQQLQANPPPLDPTVVMNREIDMKMHDIDVRNQEKQIQFQIEHEKNMSQRMLDERKLEIELKEVALKEHEARIREHDIQLKEHEMNLKFQIEMAKIEANRQKSDLDIQSKAYANTLQSDDEKELGYAKLAQDQYKTDLDAQNKAYDSTLSHGDDGEHEKSKEELSNGR